MRYPKLFINSVLLLTISSIALTPPAQAITPPLSVTRTFSETNAAVEKTFSHNLLSYDQIINFIDQIESGQLDEICRTDELEKITDFLVTLARQGSLPNCTNEELVLENDIEDLLNEDDNNYEYSFSLDGGEYVIIPAISTGSENVILCKNWFKKKIKKIKNFIKDHKTEILLGAIVVVAIVAIVVTAGTAAPAVAPAAAAASAGAAATESENSEKNKIESNKQDTISSNTPAEAHSSPNLKEIIEEHISSFKKLIVEDNLLQSSEDSKKTNDPLGDRARDLGAFLAHETLEGVSQLAAFAPQLLEEIKEIGSRILPNKPLPNEHLLHATPIENYEHLIAAGHQKIDQVFSTDQAAMYNQEAKKSNEFAIGILPPPGLLTTSSATMNFGRIPATQASNVIGWSIGQPIENLTKTGKVPKWSTVRKRHWKNQAYMYPDKYEAEQLERMKQGLAPQRFNNDIGQWESMELHHNPAQRDGGLFDFVECWPDEHALLDGYRRIGE